jgi:hypothetical protein
VLYFETSVSARGTFEIGFHLFGLGFFFLPAFGRFFPLLFGFSYFSNDIRKISGGNGAEVLDDLRGLAGTSVQLLKQSLFNYQHLSATVLKGCVMIPGRILDWSVKRFFAAVIESEKVKTILPFVEERRQWRDVIWLGWHHPDLLWLGHLDWLLGLAACAAAFLAAMCSSVAFTASSLPGGGVISPCCSRLDQLTAAMVSRLF